MAADQKEKEMGGEVVEGDQQEETYQQKFQEMQKYIPFLEMMIQRLERSSDKSREAQLIKMKSLLSILSNTKKKLKISTLERCEDVLQKLHDKVEKGINAQTKPSAMKPEEKVTSSNSQESSNSGISDNASSSDGNEQNTVTSSSDSSSVTTIMKTLRLVATHTSVKSVSSAASCPVSSSDHEGGKDDHMTTASSSVDKISSPEKKNKAPDVLEQSRERLKKVMEQQSSSISTESGNKLDGHSSSLSVELQYQTDPPWQKQDHEKRASKSVYSHNTVAGVAVEDCSRLERVKDISSSEGPQYDDEHYNSVDISRSLKHDESYAGWSDYKPPAQCVRPSDSVRHGNTVQNKLSFSPSGNRVPADPHSPTSLYSVAANSGNQACTSPVKRALPQFPTLYNVLKHPPAAGSKPLSDADIEELLEDTKRSEPEPEKKEEPMHMSLRAKLEQEIQQVHRVGVSKGGALRSLVQKDEKLKSPVRNVLDIMKPSSEPKKDRLMTSCQQASSKSGSITGSALKVNHDKEKGNDISQSRQNSGSHFAEKGGSKNDFANVNDTAIQPTIIKDKRPTDPRRHAGFSPRREEVCQSSSGEDVHTSVGEKKYPCSRPSTDIKSNIDDSSSNNRDLSVHSKSEGTAKKEGAGILSSLSKEELQKIVEENLRNLPSPPPNTKEILETVSMNSPAAVKSSWQQSTEFQSPHPSPLDYKQPGFMTPLHSSQYGSQAESHVGNGRNSASYSSAFGGPRAEDRRGLLPTPNIPLDPRILPRNLNQDPRCSRDNQGLSNIHDPRLNTSNYPHRDNFRSGIAQHTSHDQYMRPVPSAFHQNSRTHFHTNQTQHVQASSRWGGTACYGVLSHNSPRPPDESFVLPEDSYSHHGANSSRYQCSPHSSQHEFRQVHSLHDQFSDQLPSNHQQHPSWQSPPSSQGFRSGSSADYPSSVRSVGQPVQHPGNSSHSVSKIPVGDPRLCNQFTGHRSPMTPQNTTSAASSRSAGGTGTHSHVQSTESRSANTLSERDPRRRRSIEELEKRDYNARSNRDIRNISSGPRGSNYGLGPERVTDRRNSNERRRESDSKKFESISCNRRRSSPEPKETELVSPLNSLYDIAAVPKTGKGYGFQKFRIPKIKRPPSPPKSKSPPPPKAKSPPPKLESSHVGDTKEKVELVKPSDETPLTKTETMPYGLKVDDSNDIPDNDTTDDDKINVEGVSSKDSENALPEKSSDIESDNRSAGSRSKEEVTQEWIEALIRKSFESGEGKKYIEQARLLEKLGESLKGKKLRKIKQILESDSESDDSVLETSKKKESTYLEKEDQKTEEKEKQLKKAEIPVERSKKSKCRRVILSDDDDDQSTDSEALASRLKKEGTVEVYRPLSTTKGKDKLEKEDKNSRVEEGDKSKKEKQSTATGDAKPVKRYSKRRSALELLQEDIRDMFICEGVVTATGHRMCRLLKETPPGMTVDEVSKSTVKRTEDEVSTAAEESDGSSVCKRRSRKLVREKEFDKKGREEKIDRKQKMNVRIKDEETGCGYETVSETNEKVRSSRMEKKDDSHMDETDSSGSPVTKARKKCEKSKWKGYVIEESEDSNDDLAVDKVDNNKERTQERKALTSSDKPPGNSYSHGQTRSKQNATDDSETSNSEHGRRTRLPRVILEKADISKLSLVSSKPRTRYFEDSSSEGESVIEDSTLSPVCSVKSKFKVVRKSRAKVKHVLRKRGRRCVSKRGRKKCLKIDGNDEASTDVESIVSDQSSIASTVSHQTNWENTCSPIGFMFQRKYIRKRSKLLGKKIDDIIKRLTKDADGCKATDITVNNLNSEGKPSESGKIDSYGEGVVAETANVEVKEKENVKHDGTSESATSKTDSNLAKSFVKTDSIGASKAGRKRNSRIMLSLVRKFGVQKKMKKKKTKWQLGIINSPKKKGGIKNRTEGGTKDVTLSASSEKEVNEVNKTVSRTNHTVERNSTNEGERGVSTKECLAEDDKLVNSKQKVTVGDNSDKKIDMKHISELEDNKKNAEMRDICVNISADEVMVVSLNSEKTVARRKKSPALIDRSYVLDGSAKYACKLCSAQCKSIVSHYKNFHQDSEVLISRLPEEEAMRAIAEASESNYKEEEGIAKTGKRTRKQAGIFICRICDYSATFAVNFYEHLSSHTGEYRFKCGECKYEAPTRHSLKGHFYYRHPELKGFDGVRITVLAPGPSNDAKFVFGYLCSSCNYIQLLKHNIERHISLKHVSESHAKFIRINMSKVVRNPNDTAESESNNMCTDDGTNESSGYVGDKVLLGDENISDENMCNVISPVTETEVIAEEGIQTLSSSVTRIDVTEHEPEENHTGIITKPCDTVVENCMGKEQISEIEPLGVVCVTQSDNFANSCTLTSEEPSDITVVGVKPDTVSKEKPDTVCQESCILNSADVAIKVGDAKLTSEIAKEDLVDVDGRQMKQKIDGSMKKDEHADTTSGPESSTSGTEEAVKEVDLKAFVCSDDLEEENSVIQKERLKKMEEIAKNLKNNHPQFLQSKRSLILDHLSDKLKTGFRSRTHVTAVVERNETVDSVTDTKESESRGCKSQPEMVGDVSTLIDEKRAIEAAQAVQNLLRAEKETVEHEQSPSIGRKLTDSFSGSKSGKHTKPCSSDAVERRITRSFSKNGDDVDIEGVDESSSDISFGFEAEDNDEIAEYESQSPETLLNETLSALKDVGPEKSRSRMFDIIERLASKVVPKTEPADEGDNVVETGVLKPHTDDDDCSNKEIGLETSETGLKNIINKKWGTIGKPPPLISLEAKERNGLQSNTGIENEGSVSSVRVGPLEVRRFSDGLLYSCCIRGCIFASTSRMSFASHIELNHKVSRWDGSCRACNTQAKGDRPLKLSHAVRHLIEFHLVASPYDLTISSASNANEQDILTSSTEKTYVEEREVSAENTHVGSGEMPTEQSRVGREKLSAEETYVGGEDMALEKLSVEQGEMSTENTSVGEGENCNRNEGATVDCAPRNFIRLRRLSGDLLSVPKPAEDSVMADAQQQALRRDDTEFNQLLREWDDDDASNNEDSGPFLKIESVVSLNPEAMGTEDVNEILKAVEDTPNSSKLPEKSDSGDCSNVVTSSPPSSFCTVSSAAVVARSIIESSMPFMTTTADSSTNVLQTSSPDVQLLSASSSSSALPLSLLRGKAPLPPGTMHMIPMTQLPKSSTITILPSLQPITPVKLSNVQLSPVKLANFKSSDVTSKPSVSTNIPHSLVGLAQITRPTNSKITVAKERHSTGVVGGGVWCNQVLPNILPKGTLVRVEIKDNQITTKTPVVLTTKSQSPVMVNVKAAPSLTLATKTTTPVPKAPISSVSAVKGLEVQVPATKAPQKGRPPSAVLPPPPVPVTPASNTVLTTVISKNKLPHKTAVAPSYAKASKVPSAYKEMIKPVKLRHLYKCMGRLCCYTTDSMTSFAKHYNEHEIERQQQFAADKKKGRPSASKISDWQQCAYCCAMQTSLEGVLNHIHTEHSHCLYQCAYCFYRAVTKSYVVLHQNTSHTNEHVAVLMCKNTRSQLKPVSAAKCRSSVVTPYVCEQGNCGATFYIPDSFLRHLEKEHSQLAIYSCHLCPSKNLKPDRLLAHYKLHSCCFYQCMYCLHGTDTKEEMHHHLCNFHPNQMAKVIIRATRISEDAVVRGSRHEQGLLEALNVLDLDEGVSDDGMLLLPPSEKEQTTEDFLEDVDVTQSELQEPASPNITDGNVNISAGLTTKDVASCDEPVNTVSTISSEISNIPTDLLLRELTKETNKRNDANTMKTSDCPDVIGGDDKMQSWNPTASGMENKNDDIVIIDDDGSGVSHGSDQAVSCTQPVQPTPHQNSHASSEVCLQPGGMHPSQSDSDVDSTVKPGSSQQEGKELNGTQESDVIVLDSTTDTESEGAEIMGKDLATKENTHLILPEPLVTLKHRNPRTTLAIEAAVDPLSLELPQKEDETSNVTSSLQSTSNNSLCAENPHLDSENINSMVSSTEMGLNECGASGVDDDDMGLSGSLLYQCGYVTCAFTAEDSSLLKDHLLVCDLARASSSLTCVHCKKQFKYVNSLIDHLRTHGTRRFRCALCSFRTPAPQQVVKHMKQRHRVGSTRIAPLDPFSTDPETAIFVVFPKDKGRGGRRGNGKDTHDVRSKTVFLPEEVEILPRQAIYTRPVRCATCSYTTKVRSNMARHLHLHLTSNSVPDVTPPNNAPVNPVPCLEKKEMMFDKMTNLAASSHIAAGAKASETPSGSVTLSEEMEKKLPKFVPEPQRYVCGAPGCSYLTCDETMLRYHLRALHFDEPYRCPHCPASTLQENMGQIVSIERMGAHLKMHDSRLYKCAHCMYHHFQRYVVERHLADKHPEKRPFVHVVREPEMETGSGKTEGVASTSLEGAANSVGAGVVKNPWHCGLCKFRCSTRSEVLEHTWGVHGLKSQFKCGLCSYRSSSKASFDAHFGSKHPASGSVELIHVYFKVDAPHLSLSPAAKSGSLVDIGSFDTTPLWRRDMQRIRHIRGILLEEEGDVPKPDIVRRSSVDIGEVEEAEGKFGPYGKPIGNLYFCTLCNKYRTKFKADFRDHLYRELSYHKWVCTHCSLMSCNKSTLQKHSAKVHEKDRKPEAIAPLTPNEEIEEWVDKVISTQLAVMKAEQHAATSGESASISSKASGAGLTNLSHPGPSGLSGRGSKAGHGVPGSGGKVSMLEKEDVVLGSSCDDIDIGTSKKKVPGVRDQASASPVDSKTYEGSLYTKMKAPDEVKKMLTFPCKHCNMKFAQIRGLKVHIRHNHLKLSIWTCGHCGYVANSEESVLNHSKVEHPDLPPRSMPHTKGSCVKLDDEFWQREYGLGQGSESKYSSSSSVTPSSSLTPSPTSSPLKKRQRSCSPADESEGSVTSLSLAEQSVNKCMYCDYYCRSASDLKYHVMRHWVQKPFKCGYCDFEGVREYEIKKHSAKIHPLKKLRVIEKPMPSQPDIRPLQRNKRSKPDGPGSSSGSSVIEIEREKVMQCNESQDTDDVSTVQSQAEDEQQNTIAVPNLVCCFYCPQRGTSVVSIHQHWQEKHKNKLMGPNGVIRLGLPFKYKEVNMKQFLKGKNVAAGRRPAFQCSYCRVRGTLSLLEAHQKTVHSDRPFRVSEAKFTHYECADCHYIAFTVSTLKKHFEMEHAGMDLRYLVRSSKASTVPDAKNSDLLAANKSAVNLALPGPSSIVVAKYMCLWCEETCDSENTIQVHHAMCHSHLQLRYSVEKSSTPASTANISKTYSCPSCSFMSDSSQSMSEHLQHHVKPCKTDYKTSDSSSKNHNHVLVAHAIEDCEVIQVEDAEEQLEKLRSDSGFYVSGGSGMKFDTEAYGIPSPSKRLCVARKSTTLFPRIGKFHSVARKSTTPLPSQTARKVFFESYDVEQGDTSAPSSRSESPINCSEFSYYGTCPAPVDTHRITACVKLQNNLGVNMNVSLATMEKLTNLYPVVRVKDLKYEKWDFL